MDRKPIEEYMFRYLEKYYGKYRVKAYYDLETLKFPKDDSFDDLYIPCNRSQAVVKHTYIDYDLLAVCFYDKQPSVAQRAYNDIKNKYPKIDVKLECDGNDSFIYFYDKDIESVADIMKFRTSGSKIKWSRKSNLPKKGEKK